MHVEYAADEPRPAPIGRLDDAVNVAEKLGISFDMVDYWDSRFGRRSSDCHVQIQERSSCAYRCFHADIAVPDQLLDTS